jgi:glycosyltransferase involved in cell wall biosynthesis
MAPARVTVVGRPFAPIGMGEFLRTTVRALRAAGVDARVSDAYGMDAATEGETGRDLRPFLAQRLDADVSIFVLNGDERAPVFGRLGAELDGSGYKIVYPAWELPRYPEVWARELEHYDEVWGFSRYTRDALAGSVRRPVHHMPLACQPVLGRHHARRHFGISESAYVFVFFFDLTSYVERKNPFALLSAFAKVREARPFADLQLAVKVTGAQRDPAGYGRFLEALEPVRRSTVLIDRVLGDDEVKSLVRAGDAFVSLHRAEGFGLGLAEAMYFGKPVVATGYSGNMDFTTPEVARLVSYRLVPVGEGQYPHGAGQVWAEPDVDEAAAHMLRLLDDPAAGRALGARASAHVRTHFSLRAAGLRCAARIDEIMRGRAVSPRPPEPGPVVVPT